MTECRELLQRALTELHARDFDSETEDLINEIINYFDNAPGDEVYAHYDADGQRTTDPDQIRSTLLVRK